MLCQVCQVDGADLYRDGDHVEPRCQEHRQHNLCQIEVGPGGVSCKVCGTRYEIVLGALRELKSTEKP